MQKVMVIGVQSDKKSIIYKLHKLGILELRKSNVDLADDVPSAQFSDLSDMLIKVNGALQIIPKQKNVKKEVHLEADELLERVRNMQALTKVYELSDRRKQLEEDIAALSYAKHIATIFKGIDIDFSTLKSNVLNFRSFEADKKTAHEFASALERAKINVDIVRHSLGKKSELLFIAYDKKANIDENIKGLKLKEYDLNAKYLDGTPSGILKKSEVATLNDGKELNKIDIEMLEVSKKHYSELLSIREMLEIEISRSNISSVFKRTDSTFIVEGWLAKKKIGELRKALDEVTKGRYYLEELKTEELAPTLVNRPKFLKPFDYMMEFYSVPRSDEIDPTWIFILSFPIFYGLMVTDVGYGIASLIFVTYITKITNPDGLVYNAAKIWQLTSIAAIIFGFLANQYFGFQLNQYFTTFTGFDWLKNATVIIGITILFGIIQVSLGLLFGFINEWRHHKKLLAISKLTGISTIAFGTVAVAAGFFNLLSSSLAMPAAIISVISLVATGAMSGIEASELTNLITHPLSYARLMGFGLGSVIIAMLIDKAFAPTFAHGIIVFFVLLVVFITLHFLNMILAIFEGIVQGVRLNFVEFFSKFYMGGGIKFRPFSYRRVYTKEKE